MNIEKQNLILCEIQRERTKQDQKWGEQNHAPVEWLSILGEEFGEVCKATCEAHFAEYKTTGDYSEYRKELIQVAAVAVAMVESYDRSMEAKNEINPV